MRIERVDPAFLSSNKPYQSRFLDPTEVRHFATRPEQEMPLRFVEGALAKGDECYGIFDEERLASYGWYSTGPTTIEPQDLVLHFSPEYVYMYKGLTLKAYRGQRLHAIGMTRALESYLNRGFRGIVSYVESNNFSSLRSVYRMGYLDVGSIYVAKIFGRYLIYADRGCKRYGLRLECQQPSLLPEAIPSPHHQKS